MAQGRFGIVASACLCLTELVANGRQSELDQEVAEAAARTRRAHAIEMGMLEAVPHMLLASCDPINVQLHRCRSNFEPFPRFTIKEASLHDPHAYPHHSPLISHPSTPTPRHHAFAEDQVELLGPAIGLCNELLGEPPDPATLARAATSSVIEVPPPP